VKFVAPGSVQTDRGITGFASAPALSIEAGGYILGVAFAVLRVCRLAALRLFDVMKSVSIRLLQTMQVIVLWATIPSIVLFK